MTLRTVGFAAAVLGFWASTVMFGSLLAETVLLYPNVFHDVPRSLETTSEFLAVINPGDYFPVIGTAALATCALAVIVNWTSKAARYWFLGSVLLVALGDFLLSALFMWERNMIMFQEGAKLHTAAYLQQIADEFQTAHWARLAAALVAAVFAFLGVLHLYRDRILSTVDDKIAAADGN